MLKGNFFDMDFNKVLGYSIKTSLGERLDPKKIGETPLTLSNADGKVTLGGELDLENISLKDVPQVNNFSIKTSLGQRISQSTEADSAVKAKSFKNDSFKIENLSSTNMTLIKFDFNEVSENVLKENLTVLQKEGSKIQGLEKMQELITRVKPGYSITLDDYNIIKGMNTLIESRLNDKSNQLSETEVQSLQKFTETFDRLEDCKNKTEIAYNDYRENIQQSQKGVEELTSVLTDVEAKLKSKGITPEMLDLMMKKSNEAGITLNELNSLQTGKMDPKKLEKVIEKLKKVGVSKEKLDIFFQNYKEVMLAGLIKDTLADYSKALKESGNEPTLGLALYQVYMQKFVKYLASGQYDKEPKDLGRIMMGYNNLVKYIDKISSSDASLDDKKKQLGELTANYAGKDPKAAEAFKVLIEAAFAEDSDALNIVGGETLPENLEKKPKCDKAMERIKKSLIAGAGQDKIDIAEGAESKDFKFIETSPVIKESLNKIVKQDECYLEKVVNLINSRNNFALELRNMSSVMQKDDFRNLMFLLAAQEIERSLAKDLAADSQPGAEIDKIVNEYIKNADELQAKLDLSVEPGKENIVSLLNKFKEIISRLDIETRQIIKARLEAQMIDFNFSRQIRENKEKQVAIDQAKATQKEIFQKSNEVRLANIPYEAKQEIFSKNSAKLALIELYLAS